MRSLRIAAAIASLLIASVAWGGALTRSGQPRTPADRLVAAQTSLLARVDTCTDGECTSADALKAEHAALSRMLDGLQAARARLEQCRSCGDLDRSLARAEALRQELISRLGTWDEQT